MRSAFVQTAPKARSKNSNKTGSSIRSSSRVATERAIRPTSPWPARVLKPTSRTSRPASQSPPANSSRTPAKKCPYRGISDLTKHYGNVSSNE